MVNKDPYVGYGSFWGRLEKKIQSDFICRPHALQLAGEVFGRKVADIGCGEGYVSRILSNLGAKVIGIDVSPTLIEKAKQTECRLKQGIEYHISDATQDMRPFIPEHSQDLAFSICVTPHLKYQEMVLSFRNTAQILKENGKLILAVPHPERYKDKAQSNWWTCDYDFLPSGEDIAVPITLYTGQGASFKVIAYPHSREEYAKAIVESGFNIQTIIEPLATGEDLEIFPKRWGKESELPFYIIYKLNKIEFVK